MIKFQWLSKFKVEWDISIKKKLWAKNTKWAQGEWARLERKAQRQRNQNNLRDESAKRKRGKWLRNARAKPEGAKWSNSPAEKRPLRLVSMASLKITQFKKKSIYRQSYISLQSSRNNITTNESNKTKRKYSCKNLLFSFFLRRPDCSYRVRWICPSPSSAANHLRQGNTCSIPAIGQNTCRKGKCLV